MPTTQPAPATSGLDDKALLDAYQTMRTIREFEERLHTEFATGEIPGFVHLYAGEEAGEREAARAMLKEQPPTGQRPAPGTSA